jgi:hypothetical protein
MHDTLHKDLKSGQEMDLGIEPRDRNTVGKCKSPIPKNLLVLITEVKILEREMIYI